MSFTINFVISLSQDLTTRIDRFMATLNDFTAKLDVLDTKVAEIAVEIAELKAKVDAGGMTADEETQVLARLETLTGALDAAK